MQELDVTRLFDNFDHQDSLAILFFMGIAFLFGFLVGYVLRSRKVRLLKKELKAKKNELEGARIEINNLIEQLKAKDSTIQRLKYDIQEVNTRADRMEKDRIRFYNEAAQLKEQLKLEEKQRTEQVTLAEELRAEISQLKASNATLLASKDKEDEETNHLAQMQSVFMATKNRLETMEDRLSKVELENDQLREQIKEESFVSRGHDAAPAATPHPSSIVDAPLTEEEPEFSTTSEKPVGSQKIDVDTPNKDDLTAINGIGPFLEKQLNDLGIYTYNDLASVDPIRVPELTRAIGHIPGRIERDKWIDQAVNLAQQKSSGVLASTPTPASDRSTTPPVVPMPQDLTVIEGIGPHLEKMLNDAGIHNWHDLAEVNDEELTAILQASGPAYQIIDPKTWPAQAQLAINGEWELLKEYREEMNNK